MATKNYYELLEISPDANAATIKAAYRAMCKKYHPDINPKTTELFKQINEAYSTLIDPVARAAYDRKLAAGDDSDDYDDDYDYSDYSYSAATDNTTHTDYSDIPWGQPVINILYDFFKYKFENAMAAIWQRNIFVLIGNTVLCFFTLLCVLLNKIYHLLFGKNGKKFPWWDRHPVLEWLQNTTDERKLYPLWIWVLFLAAMSVAKLVYHIWQITWWICIHIIKPLLIGIAALWVLLVLSDRRRR